MHLAFIIHLLILHVLGQDRSNFVSRVEKSDDCIRKNKEISAQDEIVQIKKRFAIVQTMLSD